MLSKIELKLVDDEGNYSIAHIDYEGYVNTFVKHEVDMVHDALISMVEAFNKEGKMEIKAKKDPIAEHEKFGMPHKH